MKNLLYILSFLSLSVSGQESIQATFLKKTKLDADAFIGVDNFKAVYFVKNNVLFKQNEDKIINYNNVQLGNITTVNIFNPLKINVFYEALNTVMLLDNRLAEIFKIDFNVLQSYKNVTHVSTGYDNSIWIYNQDNQQLELYDFKTNKTRAFTLPIASEILDLKSNFNACWILTKNFLYKYNYFGSLLFKIKNDSFTHLSENDGRLVLKKENTLYSPTENLEGFTPIEIPKLLIKQFFVTNETLYIYDDVFLHEYQLIPN